MCKTFNDVSLSLTCPSWLNLTQTKKFAVKSVEDSFHRFDSSIAHRCNCYLLNQGSATFFALRTGLKLNFFRGPTFKNHKCSFLLRIFITTHVSYYNFDLMRTLSLFCRKETLPPRNYGTHWHPQYVPHVQSVSRFRLCCCHRRKSRLA